jgi:WD40 repeat protein
VASSVPDKISTVYDGASGEEIVTFGEGVCVLHRPSWSPDGRQIVTGCPYAAEDAFPDGNSPAIIWDAETGQELATLDSQDGETVCVEWSPDGERILVGYGNGAVKVWDAATGEGLVTFAGHAEQVWDASWSPDGTRVASADANGAVKVWDARTGDEVLGFAVPGNTVSVNWSPDGKYISAGGFYNTPVIRRVWQSTEELIAEAKECCVTRELTLAERAQFGLPSR